MKIIKDGFIVCLEVSSWVGISIGASHCYGHLKGYNGGEFRCHEISRKLSDQEAKILNEIDRHESYEEGSETERFNDEQSVINEAVKIWRDFFPNAKILVNGQFAILEPKTILDGDINAKHISKLNKITKMYEKIPENEWKLQDELYDKWATILLGEQNEK